nr:ribonuclease H-like domain, reverse transcriptase, RNA-dependent DNA polymerase [Tanacetum cinerariifolium]
MYTITKDELLSFLLPIAFLLNTRYAPLETLLSKKPKSLRVKPAPSHSKSKPSSSKKKRGLGHDRNEAVCKEVDELTKAGILQKVKDQTLVANPIMINRKMESLLGFRLKCFLDTYKGYHQIQIAKGDEDKTAFFTGKGLFGYRKMPIGLKKAGATYQRLVDKALNKIKELLKRYTKAPADLTWSLTLWWLKLRNKAIIGHQARVLIGAGRCKVYGFLESRALTGAKGSATTFDKNGNVAATSSKYGAEADFNNMDSSTIVSHIPTYRVHIDHPKDQILGDPKSIVQTRGMAKKSSGAHAFVSYIHKQKRTNYKDYENCLFSCFLSKMEPKKGIIVRNKARVVAQGHGQEERIDYDEVFALMARIEAIRIFLAFASFMGFIVYQMDVKSDFLYGTIKEEVYVSQPPGFIDPQFLNKVYKVEKALYGLHHALRACRYLGNPQPEVQFLGRRLISWQCKKQTIVATSTTEAEYVAAANYYGQVLWIQNQMLDYGFNFMNTKIYIDNESTICIVKNPVYHLKIKHIEISYHFIRDSYEKKLIQFWNTATSQTINDEKQIHAIVDGKIVVITESSVRRYLLITDANGITCLKTKQIFENLLLMGTVTPLFATMLEQAAVVEGEDSGNPPESQPTPSPAQPINESQIPKSSSSPQNTQSPRQTLEGRGDSLVWAATTASLNAQQDSSNIPETQSKATLNEPTPLGEGSASGPGLQDTIGGAMAQIRSEGALIQSIDSPLSTGGHTPGSDKCSMTLKELTDSTLLQKRYLLKTRVMVKKGSKTETISTARPNISVARPEVSTAKPKNPPTTATLFVDEDVTISDTLVKMKNQKAKEKGIAFKDVDDSARPIRSITTH